MDFTFGGMVFPNEGATVLGNNFSTAPGGKGANQAC
jgi:sugar/nucleoside kinase (ribokinase family)